jgi:hypothetical protein
MPINLLASKTKTALQVNFEPVVQVTDSFTPYVIHKVRHFRVQLDRLLDSGQPDLTLEHRRTNQIACQFRAEAKGLVV